MRKRQFFKKIFFNFRARLWKLRIMYYREAIMGVRLVESQSLKIFQEFDWKALCKIEEFKQLSKNLKEFFAELFRNKRIIKISIVLRRFLGGLAEDREFFRHFHKFFPSHLCFPSKCVGRPLTPVKLYDWWYISDFGGLAHELWENFKIYQEIVKIMNF